jgi:peptide/nickel transport system permease protein
VRAAEPDERPAATRRASARVAITLSKALLRDVGYLIGAAVLVEEVFGLPGLGRTLVSAVAGGDGAMAEGILIVGTLIGVGVALLGNLVGGAISSEWRSGS